LTLVELAVLGFAVVGFVFQVFQRPNLTPPAPLSGVPETPRMFGSSSRNFRNSG